jgi:hypothetical protein
LVSPFLRGDVRRTEGCFKVLIPQTIKGLLKKSYPTGKVSFRGPESFRARGIMKGKYFHIKNNIGQSKIQ